MKVSVIGSGNVGATAVQRLAELDIADVVMLDIVEGLPQGKALDIAQAAPIMGFNVDITGSNDYADICDSDIVVITAGIARKPGMDRNDLLATNISITLDVCDNIMRHSPEAIIMTVTNPLDVITYASIKHTQFDRGRVFGMSGLLDSGRFASLIAKEINCSVRDINAMVLGGHGDSMVPLPEYTTVSGIPLPELMEKETIDRIIRRTVNAGAEIVGHLKTGSAFYAPSAAIVSMTEAILKDTKKIVPASVYLNGEYGLKDICLGVPVKFGKRGAEEIIELKLTEEQMIALHNSAESVRMGISRI
ncbi:malate dehydrogenase [Methanolobus halotolerans]|uniref:Malate dehydrogenase n=1 Tax=Methanolobus halotolerans TaxID=2052935 RepID=A0A4E0PXP7_9EURY|nr:malate dehydrogenase [Methanolobus halotolerans]TGC10988.1 malate dehydrogenase [Methanolobus halotolerans]